MSKRKTRTRKGGYKYSGGNWIICDYSGFKIKSSDARKTWDGYWVHRDFWEARHPQDFVRGVDEKIKADIVRPETKPEATIDGANLLTGTNSTMTGSNDWTSATLGTLDVNTTVANKMYILGDGGIDTGRVEANLTIGNDYNVTVYARLNAGPTTELRVGNPGGTTDNYVSFYPDRTERPFNGIYTATSANLVIGRPSPGFNGVAFEIGRVDIREVNTNSVSAGSL
jgi:hypothetical protein